MSRWSLRIFTAAVLISLALALSLAPAAQAVEFTLEGTVPAGQVVDDDLFISADRSVIDGTVNGDLFINSQVAEVNGTVNGNLMVYSAGLILTGKVTGSLVFAGQGGIISGQVDGTIYAASNTLRLTPTAQVGRNVFYAGYAIETQPGSTVARDLYMWGYQANVNSQSVRDVVANVRAAKIAGQIERDVHLNVDDLGEKDSFMGWINRTLKPLPEIGPIPMLPAGLNVSPQAEIGGKLIYTSPSEQAGAIQSRPAGGVSFTQRLDATAQPTPRELVMAWMSRWFQELATLLILGGIAAALLPAWLVRFANQARQRPHVNAWKGFLVLLLGFGTAFAILLGIILVGVLAGVVSLNGLSRAIFGIGLSGLAAAFGIFLFVIAFGTKLVVAQMGGRSLLGRYSPATAEHRYWPVIIGISLYMLLRLIPVVSQLTELIVTLVGLGAIWLALRHKPAAEPAASLAPNSGATAAAVIQ